MKKITQYFYVVAVMMSLTTIASCDYIKQKISDVAQEVHMEHTDSVTIKAYSNEVRMGSHPDFMADAEATCNGKKLKLDVDTSEVDLNRDGDYPVTYSATGPDGYTTTKTVRLKVTDPNRRVIYLTFDDGPSSNTGRILQILKENDVHATFFITAQNPGCFHYITEAYDFGNAIAAHTYSHKFSIYKSIDDYFADMDKIEAVIKRYTGSTSNIIRFPGGSSNKMFTHYNSDPNFMLKLTKAVLDRGYQYVDWNADSRDASCNFPTAKFVIRNACHTYGTQLCLLMHDTQAKNGTVAALPTIIKYFKDNGYEFRTLTSTGYICHHHVRGQAPRSISTRIHDQRVVRPAVPAATSTQEMTPHEVTVKEVESEPSAQHHHTDSL